MIETTRPAAPAASYKPAEEELLSLPPGAQAQTIYIAILSMGTTPTVGFALTQAGPFVSGGLTWGVNTEYGQFLNFVFLASSLGTIEEVQPSSVTPGFWVSPESSSTLPCAVNQQGCVKNAAGTYRFSVIVHTTGGRFPIDPKMVVTPLAGGGD